MIAGKMTKSNIIGTVAAMDIPEVARLTNAFCTGAKEVNPAVKCKVTFIGSFFDPPKAKEAALAQIAAGVDVIYAERFGVIEAAQEKGIARLLQHVRPGLARARHGHHRPGLGHVADHPGGGEAGAGRRLHGAGFRQLLHHGQGRRRLAPFHAWETKLPADVMALVKEKEQAILDGALRVPVNESTPVSE